MRHSLENKLLRQEWLKINIQTLLGDCLSKENIFINEPLKNHVSFKTGGNAKFFITPTNPDELVCVVKKLKENGEKYFVMGNGSNLLVSDLGFDGTVICIGKNMSEISVNDNKITAMSGALLSRIANVALKSSLTGFEFASGIPGSLGGAVVMNAGAYGGEMKDVVVKTTYLSKDGEVKCIEGAQHNFGYRKSVFEEGDVILESVIRLKEGNIEEIRAVMDDLNSRRREKQPLEFPSAGSTFKRPEGHFAAKLIDDAGLRGFKLGGAMVSEKHCGFVINYDNATSEDIYNLMAHVKAVVYDKFGVKLEPEVRLLGEF